jgi:hypothetical protein
LKGRNGPGPNVGRKPAQNLPTSSPNRTKTGPTDPGRDPGLEQQPPMRGREPGRNIPNPTPSGSQISVASLRIGNENCNSHFGVGKLRAGFRPNPVPRPVPTGRARKMMQNAPKIGPGDQLPSRFVANSGPDPQITIQKCVTKRRSRKPVEKQLQICMV